MARHYSIAGILISTFALNIGEVSSVFAADLANGKSKFTTLCASCHGPSGGGDGPVAAALPPDQKPANLALGKMKYATDEAKFRELLQKGGAAVGLNPLMPPQIGLSEADSADLYAFVSSLKAK